MHGPTLLGEVEDGWEVAAIGQFAAGLAQFVEERVGARLQWRQPIGRRIFEQPADQVDRFRRGAWSEYLQDILRHRCQTAELSSYRQIKYVCTCIHFKDLKRLEWLATLCTACLA
jgi:hypothetical protein